MTGTSLKEWQEAAAKWQYGQWSFEVESFSFFNHRLWVRRQVPDRITMARIIRFDECLVFRIDSSLEEVRDWAFCVISFAQDHELREAFLDGLTVPYNPHKDNETLQLYDFYVKDRGAVKPYMTR